MAEIRELGSSEKAFLEAFLPQEVNSDLPFVTLTYAQSLDSKISLGPGLRTTLSGPETKAMTHFLRLKHDAILVGVATAMADNPGLNCRYPGATAESQPRPVVVDSEPKWQYNSSKVLELTKEGKGKGPWIITMRQGKDQSTPEDLKKHGGEIIPLEPTTGIPTAPTSGHIPWDTILKSLKKRGINSVMIEGGANVITNILGMPELVDSVIITIAPTWLGTGGVTVSPASKTEDGKPTSAANLTDTKYHQFGADVVLCGRLETVQMQARS
jgi:2,5-diamino-6-(ribosylamino)-4(3H)-pyrimidinone 5'-phosphate reductase